MKLKFYLSIALSVCLLAGMAQKTSVKHLITESTKIKSELSADDIGIKSVKTPTVKGGAAPEVIWSEDFSNGLNGQGDNGAWTTEGDQGSLWFQTFPPLEPNGYDPDGLVPEYGDIYPNYNDGLADDEIPFTTASNGFMMFDADRANSNQTDPNGAPDATFNALDAILVSPPIDLTGVDFAVLTFWERMRMCCAGVQTISVDFSTDGGTSWAPYDLFTLSENFVQPSPNNSGPFLETSPAINISDQLQASVDLSDCRIRIVWDASLDGSGSSHYYTMFDDFQIIGLPDNDLTAGRTYFNNHFEAEFLFVTEDTPPVDLDYLRKLEYFNQPNYITRPFNFATVVTNSGGVEQTGVRLLVTAFLDDVQLNDQFESDPITIGPGIQDTLRIYDVTPDWWVDPLPGVYSFEYEIIQDAEDFRPEDNIGLPRATRISTDAGNDGFAIMQNDRNQYTNFYPAATAPQLSEDVIFANRQVFTEPGVASGDDALITHVEFVLAGTEQASTVPGEIVYVNVRTGSVVSELTDENPNFRYFEEDEVEYIIEEEDLTTGGTPVWISVELPQPILIAPDVIYQAEMEVPSIGVPSVFIALSNEQEFGSGVAYNITDPSAETPQGWLYTGEAIPMIRFRTSYILSTDAVSYESGIKLTQNYPNPVVDHTMIQYQLDETSTVTFEVFDITGKLVHSEDLGNVPALTNQIIDFNSVGLASGTYTYGIATETERLTRKMIIQ